MDSATRSALEMAVEETIEAVSALDLLLRERKALLELSDDILDDLADTLVDIERAREELASKRTDLLIQILFAGVDLTHTEPEVTVQWR